MTNKKKYQAPAFKVIKLKSLSNLLCGSDTAGEEAGEQEGNN